MSDEATFQAIDGESEEAMFGRRVVLACGFDVGEQERLAGLVSQYGVPLVVAHEQDRDTPLSELLERPDGSGFGTASVLPRLVLMSGFTQKMVVDFMAKYRQEGLSRPLWAVATPTSVTWPLGALLQELERERQATEGR